MIVTVAVLRCVRADCGRGADVSVICPFVRIELSGFFFCGGNGNGNGGRAARLPTGLFEVAGLKV